MTATQERTTRTQQRATAAMAGPAPSWRAVIGDDPVLRSAYRLCRRRTKEQDPAEYALIQLVPGALRPACWALWAAANAIDDLADDRTAPDAERAARVHQWITDLERELAAGHSADPVRRALVDTTLRWRLDLGELHGAMLLVQDDAHGRRLGDWKAWRCWGRDTLLPWFDQVRDLFDRAGVPVALRLDAQETYETFLDGVRLTDILTDFSADLAQGDLLLPDEAFDAFPEAAGDLTGRRWSPAVRELVTHLTGLARQWVTQPTLTRGMHPGPANVLCTMADLLHAQLDAIATAGPALLRTRPQPTLFATARILAPARARAALAWTLTPLTVPPPHRPVRHGALPAARAAARPAVVSAPPAHPDGHRPPQIPAAQMPLHVAVIMDGNGRWAQQRDLPRHAGHRAGATAVRETVHGALEIGLRHLTLYTFSTENWKRDAEEVDAILDVVRAELTDNPFRDLDVRIRWHGRTGKLPTDISDLLRKRERTTRGRTGLTLTMCINYGGRDEITRTAAHLARQVRDGHLHPDHISEKDFARHLPHPDMPDVDLLWRTGSEHRTSNFLPWHAAYAELHFTHDYWPDIDRRHLWQAITEYSHRQRHHGATPAAT
ncbi:polyprenyl diphosphate synthase [Streptomyces sp. AC495_CC817]|uniref:polyprenyl diphosphate synthase n=1 Tax=Streptomyces sp. AC495_CC817 TaxID=2823900 RepID=UPI0027E0869D|nr:polyprenyl diphosphate synthase [Streptomyces sp. AC495_CC817]